MDAFYASVEQRDRPELRGKPVAVGGRPEGRGVVAAASYEARKFGVKSAIPMSRAVRLCPHLVIVRPDFAKYRAASEKVFDIFRSVTPLVEPLSLDEAYLDVTENAWGEPLGKVVAQRLKAEIRAATSLTASAGVAPNKFLAKIASAWRKPDGLTVIAPERMETFLQQLPVDALWGVGPVTAERLHERGITRLVDVRSADPAVLREAVGSGADWLRQLADGHDDRPVVSEYEPKSSGSENTFSQDLTDILEIRLAIDEMARDAAQWLARKELLCRTVTIKVRYSDFTTVTRSHSAPATRDPEDLAQRAVALLDKTEAGRRPVRLLGASVHNLIDPDTPTEEPMLPFEEEDRRSRRQEVGGRADRSSRPAPAGGSTPKSYGLAALAEISPLSCAHAAPHRRSSSRRAAERRACACPGRVWAPRHRKAPLHRRRPAARPFPARRRHRRLPPAALRRPSRRGASSRPDGIQHRPTAPRRVPIAARSRQSVPR